MDFQIGVEIDNCRIVWILDSEHLKNIKIRLTTISENQRKAVIKFYIKSSGTKQLLCSESITNIPVMHAGEPSIDITASVTGKKLNYRIFLNGSSVTAGVCKFGRYTRSYKPLLITAIAAVLLIAAAALFYTSRPPKGILAGVSEKSSAAEINTGKDITQSKPERSKENYSTPQEKETSSKQTRITESSTGTAPEAAAVIKQELSIPEKTEDETLTLPVEPVFIESEITDRLSVYFNPDSSILTAEAAASLETFIGELPRTEDFDEGQFMIEVRGHCARYGTEEGRAELSRERAVVVYNFLKSEWGIEADSVISGAGASEPVTLKRDEQHLNRRVDINIKGNIRKIDKKNFE